MYESLPACVLYVYHACLISREARRGCGSPGPGVTDGFEYHVVEIQVLARNQTWILCKSSQRSWPLRPSPRRSGTSVVPWFVSVSSQSLWSLALSSVCLLGASCTGDHFFQSSVAVRSSFPVWVRLTSLRCLLALARTSSTILRRYGERGHPCLVPDFMCSQFF